MQFGIWMLNKRGKILEKKFGPTIDIFQKTHNYKLLISSLVVRIRSNGKNVDK